VPEQPLSSRGVVPLLISEFLHFAQSLPARPASVSLEHDDVIVTLKSATRFLMKERLMNTFCKRLGIGLQKWSSSSVRRRGTRSHQPGLTVEQLERRDVPSTLAAPTLLGPIDQSGATPVFRWSDVVGADHYNLWVSDLTTGQSPVFQNTGVTGDSFALGQALTVGDSYRFWAQAVGATGNSSAWSDPKDFSVGPVLQHVEVEALYLGSGWTANATVSTDALDAFLSHLVDSSYMDMLSAAGYGVGRGQFTGNVIDPADLSGALQQTGTLQEIDLRHMIQSDINDGKLPAPDANRLYVVFVEPGARLESAVEAGAGAYHQWFTGDDGSVQGTNIPYVVIPYPGDGNPIDNSMSVYDNMTVATSHEFAEGATDPFVNAWYDDNLGEIADNYGPAWQYVSWDGYMVEQLRDQYGNPMNPNEIRFQTPVLEGPSGSVSTETPTVSWDAVNGADHYDLYISDLTTGQSPVLRNQDVTGMTYTFGHSLTPGHSYRFWAKAYDSAGNASFWSSPMDFSVPALAAPVPAGPANMTTNEFPTFTWSAVSMANHYDLWVSDLTVALSSVQSNQDGGLSSRTGGAEQGVLRNPQIAGTSYTFDHPLVPGHSYRFWVRALDASNNAGPWSSAWDFSEAPLAVPVPVGPSGSSLTMPTFLWNPVNGVDHYDLWVNDLTTGQSPVLRNQDFNGVLLLPFEWYTFGQPLTAGHSYRFWVRDVDSYGNASAWSNPMDFPVFALPAPAVNDPSFAGNSTTPTLSWSAVTGAMHYEVWVDNVTAGLSQVLWNANVADTTWTPKASLHRGDTYRIWVRAFDSAGNASAWSAAKDFSIAPLATPTLGSPHDTFNPVGVTTTGPKPTFAWNAVAGASAYDLWVDDLTTGQSQVLRNMNITGTSYLPPQALAAGHNYRSWVRALDNLGDASAWSTPLDFTACALNAPVLGTPAGAYIGIALPVFTWSAVPGAGHYEIWVTQPNLPADKPLFGATVSSPTWAALSGLMVNQPYLWWVRAFDNAGNAGAWSIASEFVWI
jgi:hypothetical protein